MIRLLLSLVLLVATTVSASATAESAQEVTNKTAEVYIGVYANQLLGMSIKDNNFDIDYYLWLRWKGSDITPNKSIELLNGRQSCQIIAEEKKGEWSYVTFRCISKVTKFWDLSRFPLDNQRLELVFEDNNNDIEALKYVADEPNSNISAGFNVSGWKIDKMQTVTTVGQYTSNFGDPTLPDKYTSQYSRFTYRIHLARSFTDAGYAFKLFFPVFVAMLISLLQYFVPIDASLRFNLAVGSIFASVGASYAITNSLPQSSYMSMAELINLLTFVAILICLCGSVYSLHLFKKADDLSVSKRFDRRFVSFATGLYIVAMVLIVKFK